MEKFVNENIIEINANINSYREKNEIKVYLQKKFLLEIQDSTIKEELIEKFTDANYIKARIKDIANEFIYYHKDLEKFYNAFLYNQYISEINTNILVDALKSAVSERIESPEAYRFIENHFKKLSEKFLLLIQRGGFQSNLMNLNAGVMVANSGDSAQFMFISRAILAGFNTSNVDVRSSRYDSIIDYEGTLLKVQVKGISSNTISFKDRDRGGQGIDHTHERNRGQIITSEDCDVYVAVDKQCGLCYLIPMYRIDLLPENEKIRVNVSDLSVYLENWNIIKEVADRLPSRNG
ncbi:group I intron-associated PD-(D/E)XK endonuclease [Niallia taxi]|nr:group I intron-associated PD-(D/E)XK endonuclease [Niallia taxi]MDE5052487.1 group I intron-associated PD-(D/E)XK endonuclease [Niallia taxi]